MIRPMPVPSTTLPMSGEGSGRPMWLYANDPSPQRSAQKAPNGAVRTLLDVEAKSSELVRAVVGDLVRPTAASRPVDRKSLTSPVGPRDQRLSDLVLVHVRSAGRPPRSSHVDSGVFSSST